MRAVSPTLLLLLLALLPSGLAASGGHWPSFRGPEHTGAVREASPPVEWSEERNVLWKVPLEGSGHASPVVWGERVYVLTVEADGGADDPPPPEGGERTAPTRVHRFAVSAHELGTGERIWKTVVAEAIPHESLHPTASQASASPVTDGERVWAFFGSRGLHCLDRDGNVLWSRDLGTFHTRNEFGEGASPALAGDVVLVNQDHEGDSFIAAFDKATGEEIWRRSRDEPSSWTSPLVVEDGGRRVAIVSAANAVRGYDAATGEELWKASGLGLNVVPTPVAAGGVVWAMSGWREAHGMAIRYEGATGDLTGTDRILWSAGEGLSYVPSAVLVEGRLHFFQRFTGILSCFELATGAPCYERQRIEGFENVYASPVAAGDRIYALSRDGEAIVFRAGPGFEILARNRLEDTFNATPAIVGDTLILRGDRHLYRIGEAAPADEAPAVTSSTSAPAEPGGATTGLEPEGWLGRPIPEISEALAGGATSSVELVTGYLARIETIDWSGPRLQSVLSVNPLALEQARASDERRAAGEALGPLDGVPILLKDNIESADPLPTTAGSLALAANLTGRDSPLVAGLRAAGAVILGKTNLSQWANFRSNDSVSGWSALGGQVRNPHMLDRSPCGSSSGSGAAVAAALAAGAVGTETNGSISCPSTVNGVVGFKPTVGLVSQQHIVPISSSQDTAGPMTRTVEGTAMLLGAMATGPDATDYRAALDPEALRGARIGVARFARGSNRDVHAVFDRALEDLEAAGAILVELEEHETPDGFWGHARTVLQYEFHATLDAYLADAAPAVATRDLEALIAFNEAHAATELALFGQDLFEASAALGGLESEDYLEAREAVLRATRTEGLDALLGDRDLVAIVSPSGPIAPRIDAINGDVWPDWAGIGWMAAVGGAPHLTVPMGAVDALPIGLSFIGAPGDDARVLALGHAWERRTRRRVEPRYLPEAEALPGIATAMRRAGREPGR